MKRNDLAIVITVALSTAALTVASFWTTSLEAGGDGDSVAPTMAKPKLAVQGVEMTLSPVDGTTQAGEKPVFQLAAANTSFKAADLKVRLAMTAMSLADATSRVVRMPRQLWQGDQDIVLGPGESKTFTVTAPAELPTNMLVSVILSEATANVSALQDSSLAKLAPAQIAVLNFSTVAKAINVVQFNQKGTAEDRLTLAN